MVYSSMQLEAGRVYTRQGLRDQFHIVDATLNTGIFQPAGYNSLWLFVTEKKPTDRTEYADSLDGACLRWDGQVAGRKDQLIIEHERRELEILVFYRVSVRQYDGAGFRYEGRFRYESHAGSHPTHFVLLRDDPILRIAENDVRALQEEEGTQIGVEGRRISMLVNRYERDPKLRAQAIRLHGTQCQACGFSFEHHYGLRGEGFIEVHHLRPISTYGANVNVDPATDMAVLCANCHRMIHRDANDPLTMPELRQIVSSNQGCNP